MIPETLKLSGFLSYQKEAEIDFSSFDLACISGLNGSGKSSLLDAITWALFGQARTRDDAIINLQSNTAEVTFTFTYEDNLYKVQRAKTEGKTTLLEFHIMGKDRKWKTLTERTLRATENLIADILRLDYETFVNASFFLQGKADQFTQQRPADRKRILSSILGLEIWENYRKETFTQRRAVEKEIAALEGRLQEIDAELAEEGQRQTRLAEIETNMAAISAALQTQTAYRDEIREKAALLEEIRKRAQALQDQATETQSELDALQQRKSDRLQEKETFASLMARQDEIEAEFQAWQETVAILEEWDQTAIRFNQQEKKRHAPQTEIEAARTRLEAELESLKTTAENISGRTNQLAKLGDDLKQIEQKTALFEQALKERSALETQFQEIKTRQTKAKTENPLLKSEMDNLKSRIDQLTNTEGAACPLCGQPLSQEDRERLVDELNAEGKQKGDRYRSNLALMESIESEVTEMTEKLAKYTRADENLRESNRQLDQTRHQIETIQAEIKLWDEKGALRKKDIETRLEKEDFAHQARQALIEIDRELKEIGYDAAEHDNLRKRELEQRPAEEAHRKLSIAQATLQPLKREISEIDAQIERVKKTLKKQIREAEEADAQIQSNEKIPDLVSADQKVLELQEQENRVRMELGAAHQKITILEIQKQRRKELEAEMEELAKQVVNFKALERAFGKNGVPAMLIEQSLPQIESKANEILEKLSGGTTSIRFETQQEYKSGKREDLRETLDIQITDNQGTRGYEMFSGGEAFRINFAIRLALSEVLAQRAGARLQTLVIDEGFGSQDALSRQRLIEAINIVRGDFKKVLVITHIESLKEAFPTRIEVTKTPQGSQVELV